MNTRTNYVNQQQMYNRLLLKYNSNIHYWKHTFTNEPFLCISMMTDTCSLLALSMDSMGKQNWEKQRKLQRGK